MCLIFLLLLLPLALPAWPQAPYCGTYSLGQLPLPRAKGLVLEIVLAYLYGGRGPEAWKELDKMWPPIDKPRIRQLILKARSSGLLSEINRPKK